MNIEPIKNAKLLRIALAVMLVALGVLSLGTNDWTMGQPDDEVVIDPKSGQRVLVNQLAILGEGQDVRAIVAEYGGTITVAVPETDTYQAKFPVRSLKQLDIIARKLRKRGLKTQYVVVVKV
jgi:hypothetical protein